jgi:hypothetical protein
MQSLLTGSEDLKTLVALYQAVQDHNYSDDVIASISGLGGSTDNHSKVCQSHLDILASALEKLELSSWEVMRSLEKKDGTWTFMEARAGASTGQGAAGATPKTTLPEKLDFTSKKLPVYACTCTGSLILSLCHLRSTILSDPRSCLLLRALHGSLALHTQSTTWV